MTSKLELLEQSYREHLGFVPERIHNRLKLGLEVAPEMTEAVERARRELLEPGVLDEKTTQMLAFAMLLMNLSAAAENHAVAALRAGATVEELHAVAGIAFVFRGVGAVNLAGDAISGALKKLQTLQAP
jgi:alkylhydroperoxidase/carboxymuconolactone decarboxylase family protein YurZ